MTGDAAAAVAPSPPGPTRPSNLWGAFSVDQRRLKRALLVKGWTLAEWSRVAQVSATTAGRFLRELPVAPQSAYKLINALGLEPTDIIVDRQKSA